MNKIIYSATLRKEFAQVSEYIDWMYIEYEKWRNRNNQMPHPNDIDGRTKHFATVVLQDILHPESVFPGRMLIKYGLIKKNVSRPKITKRKDNEPNK